jgi:peroxiredoxin Q/BCP
MRKTSFILKKLNCFFSWLPFVASVEADRLKIGQPAPQFQLKAQDGSEISLSSQQGHGWTVLYFYPKAGTPGCTKQACVFRDSIQAIRNQNAKVYGISTDEVKNLLEFHQKHKLSFTLLSDPDAKVTNAYGVKMPLLAMAKRWTFIIDPTLVIRQIDDDVDPVMDAQRVVEKLKQLQSDQTGVSN